MSIVSTVPSVGHALRSRRPEFSRRVIADLSKGEPEGNSCGVALDADEAGHGAYALAKNIGTGALHDHASKQFALAHGHHLGAALAYEPLVRGGGGMAGLVGSSVCVGPFAVLAMHAGLPEWREAREKARQFDEHKKILQAERNFARDLSKNAHRGIAAELAAFDVAAASRLQHGRRSAKAASFGGKIGKYSFLSGAAIMGRMLFELVRNVGGAVESGSPDVDKAAKQGKVDASFLLGTGLAANACGCLAAAFAFMLGVNFVRKSGYFSEKWKTDAPHLAGKARILADAHSDYGRFLKEKSVERARFAHGFSFKNRMFMAGAGLYAIGTILPTAVKMLAAVGVLDSKKVGANLILALFATAIAGAVIMGVFSHQFFVGHPKLERYEEYGFKDSRELDRRFLANIDDFVFRDKTGTALAAEVSVRRGLAMRAAAFDWIQRSEAIRNTLVSEIARRTGHTYKAKTHIGDVSHVPLTLGDRLKIRFDKNRLKTEHVEAWLKTAENRRRIVGCYMRLVDEKIVFLARKEALHKRMHDQVMRGVQDPGGAQSLHVYQERKAFAERAFGSYDDARTLLAQHRRVAQKLRSTIADGTFKDTMSELLDLHIPKNKEDDEKEPPRSLERRIAEHIFEYMPMRYNHDRGNLLEIEAEAGKRLKPAQRRASVVWK